MPKDEQGNKLAGKKPDKKLSSKNKRNRAKRSNKPNVCDICGYKFRGLRHLEGSHHKKGEKE